MKIIQSYRQSSLVNYLSCPRMFLLSQSIPFQKTKPMSEGHLFEGFVLGFKASHFTEFDLPIDCDPFALPHTAFKFGDGLAGIKSPTLDSYKRSAEYAKSFFIDGDAYVPLFYHSENWILTGEADFIGTTIFLGETVRAVVDLKFTADVQKIWADKEATFKEFIQAVTYPYLVWKTTGEILPFIYVLVENERSLPVGVSPIIKQMMYTPTLGDFAKLEAFIDQVDSDFEFQPNANACVTGPYWNYECKFLMHCPTGRKLKEMPVIIPDLEWR